MGVAALCLEHFLLGLVNKMRHKLKAGNKFQRQLRQPDDLPEFGLKPLNDQCWAQLAGMKAAYLFSTCTWAFSSMWFSNFVCFCFFWQGSTLAIVLQAGLVGTTALSTTEANSGQVIAKDAFASWP